MLAKVIDRVLVVGGTHGNELTGVYLVKKFQQFPKLLENNSFRTTVLLANTQAIAANCRYIDRDLNRCFAPQDLADPTVCDYEGTRAKEIAAQWHNEFSSQQSLIIDLHSSTANMGLTLLLANDCPFTLRLAAYLSQLHSDVRVCLAASQGDGDRRLRALSPLNMAIEVGPIAQGIVDARLLQLTEMLVMATLNYIDQANRGQLLPVAPEITVYQSLGSIDYPRDQNGMLQAAIHPQRQFQDYQALNPGDPLFLQFDGQALLYTGNKTTWPIFINEAAYYEKSIAMTFTDQHQVAIAQ
jgi:succinylglutamate desuccinylase